MDGVDIGCEISLNYPIHRSASSSPRRRESIQAIEYQVIIWISIAVSVRQWCKPAENHHSIAGWKQGKSLIIHSTLDSNLR